MNYPRLFSPITIKPRLHAEKPYLHAGHSQRALRGRQRKRPVHRILQGPGRRRRGPARHRACRFNGKGGKPNVMHIDSDADITMWRAFTDELHAAAPDCKLALQLFHGGRYVGNDQSAAGGEALAPSAVFSGFSRSTPKEMSAEEIRSTIADWAAGALRARQAGFDAVEIIGSAGYLISEFLSPVTNLRTDEYGGNAENRRRFPLEVIRAVRQAVGADYPVILRMGGKDFIPGSNGLEEAQAFAVEAEAAGIDLLNVTGGWHADHRTPAARRPAPGRLAAIWPRTSNAPCPSRWPPATASAPPPWQKTSWPRRKPTSSAWPVPCWPIPSCPERLKRAGQILRSAPAWPAIRAVLWARFLTGRCAVWPTHCAAGSISRSPAPQAERFWSPIPLIFPSKVSLFSSILSTISDRIYCPLFFRLVGISHLSKSSPVSENIPIFTVVPPTSTPT